MSCRRAVSTARLGMALELAPGDPQLVYPPGFAMDGVTLNQDGGIYDGFSRPGTGVTFGTGSYILQGRDSAQGNWWIGTTDATGTNVVWHGDPVAGTGEAWKFPDPATHAAVFGSSGDIFEFVPTVASEIPGREPLGIHGVVHPVGSLHGVVAVPAITGTITGVVRPVGSLQGAVSSGAPTTISARYWSINITAKVGTEAGVSELEFAQLGAAKYAGGTASATSTFSGFPASNAIDGNISTAWVAS
jgi:hypothetical protein